MKLSKKTKTILTSSVGILAATSVVAPLATMTSCSNKTSEVESQFDKEYGVTEQTYDDLKEEFIKQYDAKLKLTIQDKEQIELRKDYLKKQLSSLDKMKDQRKNGFTSLTSAMMDFAKKDSHDLDGNPYNIKLSRKTKATWSQIDGLFNSWKGSFRQYMLNSDMPASTITRVMQDAQYKFVSLKKELQQTCNDALDGIIQAKSRIITCFEDVNDEIALVSSTMQLKEFLSQYTFTTKASADDQAACLDSLLKDTSEGTCDFKVGNVLSDTTMNRVFTIIRKDDGKPVTFTNTIIKGYTLFPKLTNITANKFSNLYTFSLDFGLTKTSYIGKYSKDQLANVTAHTYIADNYDSSDINDESSLDELIKKCAIKTIDYSIFLTKQAEQDALADAYFNKEAEYGHISFNWDDKNADNQAYESFFDNAVKQTDGTWKADLSFDSLSNSYIRISDNDSNSYKMIKDVTDAITSKTEKDVSINNLAEQFLKDCEISAIASIDERNPNNKVVKFDGFYANYNNSIYTRLSDGKLDLNNSDRVDYDAYQKQCVNHSVSKAFFEKVNIKYNNAVAYVSFYDAKVLKAVSKKNEETKEEYLERVLESGEEQKVLASLALTFGAIATTAAVFEAWKPFSLGSTKKIAIVSIIFLLVCLGLQAAIYALFMEHYYKPLVKHVEDQRTTREDLEDETQTKVIKNLIEDSSNYEFIEEDGTYDKASFEQKRKNFNKHDMTWMLEQYKEYSTLNSPEWQKFDGILKAKGVDSEDYKTKFDDWKIGGKFWWISLGLTVITVLASIGLGLWIKKQRANPVSQVETGTNESTTQFANGQNEEFKQKLSEEDEMIIKSFKNISKNTWTSMRGTGACMTLLVMVVRGVWGQVLDAHKNIYNCSTEFERTKKRDELQNKFNKLMGKKGNFDWDIATFAEVCNVKII